MLEMLPRNREKAELLDRYQYHRLRFAAAVDCHFKIIESRVRTTVKFLKKRKKEKKEICEAVTAAVSA